METAKLSGLSRCVDGTRIGDDWFSKGQLGLIANDQAWARGSVVGLLYLGSPGKPTSHSAQIQFVSLFNEALNTVDGAKIEICGFEFLLAASAKPVTLSLGQEPIRRPGGFRFRFDDRSAEVLLSWNDGMEHRMIQKLHLGSASGDGRKRPADSDLLKS
ncbi:MAG: hypothetical protein ACC655_05740 [Rhodothermia bacterium]